MTSQQQQAQLYQPHDGAVAEDESEEHHDLRSRSKDASKEITRDDALKALLTDEDLSDLTLRGSDGGTVLANRCLLASRSPVFRGMLFGQFVEASKTEIDLGYDGAILQAIVDYIYTDRLPGVLLDGSEDVILWNIDKVRFLVQFVNAANYFALPDLLRKVELIAEAEMMIKNDGRGDSSIEYSDFATLLLAACSPDGTDAPSTALQESALEFVKQRPKKLMDVDEKVVSMIHPSTIEKILKYDDLRLDEQSCFQILQRWANTEDEEHKGPNSVDDGDSDWRKSRKFIASEMTSHIRLEDIDVVQLSTTVSDSGLVTTEQLFEAYKTQALRARMKFCTNTNMTWRKKPVWKSSGTSIFKYNQRHLNEVLDCPIMKSGVHRWSLKIKEGSNHDIEYHYLELGVASTRWPIDSNIYISQQRGGWALCDGMAIHASDHANAIRQEDMPYIREECVVSFTLDLDGDGILSASIDGNTPVELFTTLFEGNGEGFGFVPAISNGLDYAPDLTVEFLGFE